MLPSTIIDRSIDHSTLLTTTTTTTTTTMSWLNLNFRTYYDDMMMYLTSVWTYEESVLISLVGLLRDCDT